MNLIEDILRFEMKNEDEKGLKEECERGKILKSVRRNES